MKFITYHFIAGIIFLSLFSVVHACDDEVIDPDSAYNAYEFEAGDD